LRLTAATSSATVAAPVVRIRPRIHPDNPAPTAKAAVPAGAHSLNPIWLPTQVDLIV